METLLLEIGTEEIPAGYIKPALDALAETLQKKLSEARISYGTAKIYGSPRRLAVRIEKVAVKQLPLKTELTGPPVKVGLDESGKPTMAAKKFAEKAGVKISQLSVKKNGVRQRGRCSKRSCPKRYWPPHSRKPCGGQTWISPLPDRSIPAWRSSAPKLFPLNWAMLMPTDTPTGITSCNPEK